MPAKSAKQEKFMRAVAHSPSFAKKVGVPMSVGREFTKSGGSMKKMSKGGYAGGGMPMVMKDGKKVPAFAADGEGKMKKGGMAKKMAGGGLAPGHKAADGIARKGKTDTKRVTMGGSTGMKKGGMTKMKYGGKAC